MKLSGVWTFCLHPSAMSDEAFSKTEHFIQNHAGEIIGFDELDLTNLRGKNLISRLLSWAYFTLRKIKGTK